MNPISVEIWSDVVCPWCYIGKRRFEAAVDTVREANPDLEVEVSYRAYQLDPTAPTDRHQPVAEVYAKKFGGPDQAAAIFERLRSEAEPEGLSFDFDNAKRANTLDAHRLLVLADRHDRQGAMKERLLQAYFTEGAAIGERTTLIGLAAEVGIDAETARSWLAGDGGRAEVAAQLEGAADRGITAVPTFVFAGEFAVPGAQPTAFFERILGRLADA